MSDAAKSARIERTPQQLAEERRIREMHLQKPIRELPTDTIIGDDVAHLLTFIDAIVREREAQGLSLEQLAAKAAIDPAALARLEAGQSFNPSVFTLFRIARALGRNLVLGMEGLR